jgi:hypothetical protein
MTRQIPIRDSKRNVIATVLVDDADYEAVARYRWQLNRRTGNARRTARSGGKATNVQMHREIVGARAGDGAVVRHLNGDTLDNRRENLRVLSGDIARPRARVVEV